MKRFALIPVAVMLIALLSVSDVSAADAYSGWVQQTSPTSWYRLGDMPNSYFGCNSGGSGDLTGSSATATVCTDHGGRGTNGQTELPWGSASDHSYLLQSASGGGYAAVSIGFASNLGPSSPWALSIWIDGQSGASYQPIISIAALGLWTPDNWSSVCFQGPGTSGHCVTLAGGGLNNWHLLSVIYLGPHDLELWVDGRRYHTLDATETNSTFDPPYGATAPGGGFTLGCCGNGMDAKVYAAGFWSGDAAQCLVYDVETCSTRPPDDTQLGDTMEAYYYAGSVAPTAQPKGTVCTPNVDGTHTCTSPTASNGNCPDSQRAVFSKSCNKFKIAPIPLDTCTSPSTVSTPNWFGVSIAVPNPVEEIGYLACVIGNVVKQGVNILIFAANAFIDLLFPDWSGVQSALDIWDKDISHRAPFGYLTNANLAFASAFGGCTVSSDGSVGACTGTSVGSGVVPFHFQVLGHSTGLDINLVSLLSIMTQPVFVGLSLRTIMAAWIYYAMTVNVIRHVQQALEPAQMVLPIGL